MNMLKQAIKAIQCSVYVLNRILTVYAPYQFVYFDYQNKPPWTVQQLQVVKTTFHKAR